MSSWWNEDGEKFANLVYSELLKNGELSFNDIMKIYENLDFTLFRKAEGVAWNIIYTKENVTRFKDKNNRTGIRLIK